MPTEEDRESAEDRHEEESKGQTPTIQFDTAAMEERIAQGVSRGVNAIFERANAQNQPLPPDLVAQEIGEDDDEQTKVSKQVHNALIPIKRSMIEFQNYGLDKLSSLTVDAATAKFPYMAKYRTEIDAELSKLAPAARADMATIKLVHDTVTMRHIDEIRNDAAESKARELLQNANPPKPGIHGGSSRDVKEGSEIPEPSDLFGEDIVATIEERGGKDRFARSMSGGRYQSWEDYAKARAAMNAQPRRNGMPIVAFRRVEAPRRGTNREVSNEQKK